MMNNEQARKYFLSTGKFPPWYTDSDGYKRFYGLRLDRSSYMLLIAALMAVICFITVILTCLS